MDHGLHTSIVRSNKTTKVRYFPTSLLLFLLLGAIPLTPMSLQAQESYVLYDSNEQFGILVKHEVEQIPVNTSPSVVIAINDQIEDNSLLDSTEEIDPNSIYPAISIEQGENLLVTNQQQLPTNSPPLRPQKDILIDMRHAHDFSDFPLTLDDRYYHRIYSFHRGFEMLRNYGYTVDKHTPKEPLDYEKLSRYKTLFMNLPSGDKEPFLISEITAIRDYVTSGGSLFLITDHTNCYFHQSRLTPLFHELDIEPQHYGVCDAKQALGSSGVGWIYVDHFDRHPVTHGLREIGIQTGGGVDPRFAVAWSGKESWKDSSNMPLYGEADVAFFGNFVRDSNEPIGPSGVILAREFGKGKILIVADQNLFSAFFLQYLDVYRLWLNSFAWTCNRPATLYANADITVNTSQGSNNSSETVFTEDPILKAPIVCWEDLRKESSKFGDPDTNGYYHIYSVLCRYLSPFCIAHDAPEIEPEVFVLIHGGANYQIESFNFAYRQLLRGKRLVVIDPVENLLTDPNTEISALLEALKNKDAISYNINPTATTTDNASETNDKQEDYLLTIHLSNGGTIVLVKGESSYRNASVPKPEGRVTLSNQKDINRLIESIGLNNL